MPDGVGFLSFATERVKTNKNVRSKEAALAAATESGQLLSKQLPNLKPWEGFGLQSQHYSNSLIILMLWIQSGFYKVLQLFQLPSKTSQNYKWWLQNKIIFISLFGTSENMTFLILGKLRDDTK